MTLDVFPLHLYPATVHRVVQTDWVVLVLDGLLALGDPTVSLPTSHPLRNTVNEELAVCVNPQFLDPGPHGLVDGDGGRLYLCRVVGVSVPLYGLGYVHVVTMTPPDTHTRPRVRLAVVGASSVRVNVGESVRLLKV